MAVTTPSPTVVWTAIIGAGIAYEAAQVRRQPNGTISHYTRTVTRTHHPVGRTAFAIGWGAFAVWFAIHIIDPEKVSSL